MGGLRKGGTEDRGRLRRAHGGFWRAVHGLSGLWSGAL